MRFPWQTKKTTKKIGGAFPGGDTVNMAGLFHTMSCGKDGKGPKPLP